MTVTPGKLYVPHPLPRRGLGFFLGYSEKLNRIVYGSDNLVWMRGVEDHLDAAVYTQHRAKITVASYSPSSRYIASADEEGYLRIWEPGAKDQNLAFGELRPISGPIFDLSWTEDSERLAYIGAGSNSYGGAINAKTGASIGEVMGHTQTVQSVALRAQRPYKMVTGGDDSSHVFYKGPPFKFDHTAHDHEKFITSVRYAPDGSVYATSGLDGKIQIYDGQTGHFVSTITINVGISAVAFSPDSKQIIAALMDGRVVTVNVDGGAKTAEWTVGSQIYQQQMGVLWTSKNIISVSLNGDFNFLQPNGKFTIDRGHIGAIQAVAKTDGGFVSGDANGQVLFWKYGSKPYAVFGPDGGLPPVSGLANLGDGTVAVGRADGVVTILKIEDGSVVKSVTVGKRATGAIVAGPGYFATYTEKNLVIVTGGTPKTVAIGYVPTAIAIAPDGAEFAVGGADKLVHLYSKDGAEKGTITGLFKEAAAVSYSPDGVKIAATSENKEIIVWNRSDLKNPILDGWRFHSLAVTKILWFPDNIGLLTIAKDRSIRLWSLEKKRKYVEIGRAHEQQLSDAFWIEDGTSLLTAGFDGAIKTWTVTKIE
jgi:WD40 repeat protein